MIYVIFRSSKSYHSFEISDEICNRGAFSPNGKECNDDLQHASNDICPLDILEPSFSHDNQPDWLEEWMDMHGVPDIVDDSDYQDFEKYLFKLAEQDNSATDHSGQVGSRKDCALQCEVQSLELLEPVNGRQHLPTADHYTSHEKKKSSRKATNSQQHFSLQRKFHGGCICKPLRKVLLQSFFKSVEFAHF